MNIKRSISHRLTAGSLLALASIVSVPQALAFYNGTTITNDEKAPSWSAFLGNDCSAIQLTPHVAISTDQCIYSYASYALYYPKESAFLSGWSPQFYTGPERYNGVLGEVGLAIMDTSFPAYVPADILSYKEERRLLVNGNDDLTAGAMFLLASGTPPDSNDGRRHVTTTQRYENPSAGQNARPLIYRSVSRYHQLEPERFQFGDENPLFTPDVLDNLYVQRNLNDAQVNAEVLLSAGIESDRRNGIISPVTGQDLGGGVFYKRENGGLALVGLIASPTLHTRLSHYWPWVYGRILSSGLKAEAIAFSQRVLGTGDWGSNDRHGQVGDIYVYDNPYNHEVEFFRLTRLGSDQRYWYFPTDKRDNYFWTYLGTSLPTIEEAVGPDAQTTSGQHSVAASASAGAFPELGKSGLQPELNRPATGANSIGAIAAPNPLLQLLPR